MGFVRSSQQLLFIQLFLAHIHCMFKLFKNCSNLFKNCSNIEISNIENCSNNDVCRFVCHIRCYLPHVFSISKILSLRGCGQLWLKVVRFVELKDTGLKVALGYQK